MTDLFLHSTVQRSHCFKMSTLIALTQYCFLALTIEAWKNKMLNSERVDQEGVIAFRCTTVQSYKFTPAALAPLSKTVPTRQGSLAARDKADERNAALLSWH